MKSKQEFRTFVKKEVKQMSPDVRRQKTEKIISRIRELPSFKQAGTILMFFPIEDEVNILPLFNAARSEGKTVCFPLCGPNGEMTAHEIISIDTGLLPGKYGISEPDENCACVDAENIDCIITPGRCFDKKGNRIGRGGGYYDKFLMSSGSVTIAPAFSFQVFEQVPIEKHDQPVDVIVTEHEIITAVPENHM